MYVVTSNPPATFDFEIAGEQYRAVALQSVPMDKAQEFLAEAAKGDDMGFAVWVVDNLLPEESREAVHSLAISDAAALVKAYIEGSKADPGE